MRVFSSARVVVGVALTATVILSSAMPAAAATPKPKYSRAYGGGVMCMDVPGWSMEDGARIIQWQCHGGGNQLWYWEEVASTVLAARPNRLRNAHSNKCLDVPFGNYYNGAPLQQYGCHPNGRREQSWVKSGCANGYCRMEFTNSATSTNGVGYCVDIPEWGYGSNGTQLTLWQCGPYYNQDFAPW